MIFVIHPVFGVSEPLQRKPKPSDSETSCVDAGHATECPPVYGDGLPHHLTVDEVDGRKANTENSWKRKQRRKKRQKKRAIAYCDPMSYIFPSVNLRKYANTLAIFVFLILMVLSVFSTGVDASSRTVLGTSLDARCKTSNLPTDIRQKLFWCPDDYEYRIIVAYCNFSCDPGTSPRCINTKDGAFNLCLEENLKCSQGIRISAEIDPKDPSIVRMKEEQCPAGTYQPTESDCVNSCGYKHKSLRTLEPELAIYKEGNHIFPTIVYCNFDKGYYNPERTFLFDYDQMFTPWMYCTSVDTRNPCINGTYPLPNGTCLYPCPNGLSRNPHDGFICSAVIQSEAKTHPLTQTSTAIDAAIKDVSRAECSVRMLLSNARAILRR